MKHGNESTCEEGRAYSRSGQKTRLLFILPAESGLRDVALVAVQHVGGLERYETDIIDLRGRPLPELLPEEVQLARRSGCVVCCERSLAGVADLGVPTVAAFTSTAHYDIQDPLPPHCTVVYPDSPTCPGHVEAAKGDVGRLLAPAALLDMMA